MTNSGVKKTTCCLQEGESQLCERTECIERTPLLEIKNLCKVFKRKGLADVAALNDVSFSVFAGESLGVVGESGSGKSTLANIIACFIEPTSGLVYLQGEDITHAKRKAAQQVYQSIQMVFQNPVESFDPRQTLGQSITEGMRNAGSGKHEARRRACELLEQCGLSETVFNRFPREVSGGQCQRAAIARALARKPRLLICDEATSALDVTVQRQIIDLLNQLRAEYDMALLFICHDLALVGDVCDRVMVMKSGAVVEQGLVQEVLYHPQTEYVKLLLSAVL